MPQLLMAILICVPASNAAMQPWQRHTIDKASRGADGVRLADANRDGLPDIATAWEEGGLIRLYINPGADRARLPWPSVTVGHVASPEDAVLVDLDRDGALDVVSSCEGRNRSIFVHWAPADVSRYLDGNAWETTVIPCSRDRQMWMFALPMQIDGRYGPDLIVGSKGDGASIGWLRAPARPRKKLDWQYRRLSDAGWIMSLVPSDLDSDGDLDVLASDRKGANRGVLWLENPGPEKAAAGSPWIAHRLGANRREVMFLALGGHPQSTGRSLFCAVRGGSLWHLEGDLSRPGSLERADIAMPVDCGTGKAVAIGDIDGDAREDLVFTCENAQGPLSGVRWLSRNHTASNCWQDHEISGPEGTKFDRVELLDLDADGDLDVLTCEERENLGVIWYENPYRHVVSPEYEH